MSEHDPEAPIPDAVEQHEEVADEPEAATDEFGAQSPDREQPVELPFDANEADAADQRREVRLDEDDYR
jgi:hypothetical protein